MRDLVLMGLVVLAFFMPSNVDPIVNDQVLKDLQSYVEISDKAYENASEKILPNVKPDTPDFTEKCNGSGWITQGDGHRTQCPGCENCGKGLMQMELKEASEVEEEIFKESPVEEEKAEEKVVASQSPSEDSVKKKTHSCKCDTKSTYCRCVETFGVCNCNNK